jgi:copper transport protein
VQKILISVLMMTNPSNPDDRSPTVSPIGPRPDPSRPDRLGVRRRCRSRLWTAAIITAIILGQSGTGTQAHALLERSVPQNGATLSHAPDGVLIVFTEQPEPDLSRVQVLDASGRTVAGGAPRPVQDQPLELRLPLPSLSRGIYTVTWRTVSRIDGHVAAGVFSFGVGIAASATLPPQALNPPPSALYVLSRMLLYLGLSGLLAIALAGAAALPLGSKLRPFLLPAWTSAAVGLVLLAVAQARDAGIGLLRLLGTPLGHQVLWRALPIGAAAFAVGSAFAGCRPRQEKWAAVGVSAALAILAHVVAGHAGGAAGARLIWNVLNQWAHFAAIGVWGGGLLGVWFARRARDSQDYTPIVIRLSIVTAGALIVAGVTGALRAAGEVAAWSILISTSFGVLVLLKTALFVVIALLGAFARHLTFRPMEGRVALLNLVVAAEMAAAAGALGVTAYLTGLPVPIDTEATVAPPAIAVTGADYATSVRARLLISPALPGTNHFTAEITDYDSHRPVAHARVTLRFTMEERPDIGPSRLTLSEGPPGVYQGEGANLTSYGRWSIAATIEGPTRAVEVPLQLVIPSPRQTVRAVSAPGKPTIYLVDLSGGRTLSIYLDPRKIGFNAIHGTFIDARGQELVLARVPELSAARVGERLHALPTIQEGPGHFSASGDFGPGEWRFQILATVRGGEILRVQVTVRL